MDAFSAIPYSLSNCSQIFSQLVCSMIQSQTSHRRAMPLSLDFYMLGFDAKLVSSFYPRIILWFNLRIQCTCSDLFNFAQSFGFHLCIRKVNAKNGLLCPLILSWNSFMSAGSITHPLWCLSYIILGILCGYYLCSYQVLVSYSMCSFLKLFVRQLLNDWKIASVRSVLLAMLDILDNITNIRSC